MSNPASDPAPATAVLVFHGMGQQVPLETLGNVAETLRNRREIEDEGLTCHVAAQNVSCQGGAEPDAVISRIRMTLQKDGVTRRHVDFYESYWAPITAGKINVLDALMFLVNAGRVGILRSFSPFFVRYFWSGRNAFRLPRRRNIAALGGVLLLVLSLAFIATRSLSALHDNHWRARLEELSVLFRALHLIVFPTLLSHLVHTWKKSRWTLRIGLGLGFLLGFVQVPWIFLQDLGPEGSWLSRSFSVQEPLILNALKLLLALTAFSVVIVAARVLSSKKPEVRASFNGQLIWAQTLLLVVTILSAAGGAAYLMAKPDAYTAGALAGPWLQIIYGLMGLGVLFGLRYFLLEYVGDLAAYLSAHEASKFQEMRSAIQAEAFKAACHVYASDYEQVNVVGHSLGSVLAYDTLNGVLIHDALKNQAPDQKPWNTVGKTRLLLTFGSPLDKAAFIFRAQVKDNPTREVLAAAKQPLLEESHRYRPDFWINVWSRSDVISARLDFYDRGKAKPRIRVGGNAPYAFTYEASTSPQPGPICSPLPFRNPPAAKTAPVLSVIDPKADIPFAAHTQFWDNPLIYDILAKSLFDKDPKALERLFPVSAAASKAPA